MYIFISLVTLFLIALLLYIFGRWKFRKNVMKKFANELRLDFTEKNENCFILSGAYKNKNIVISETKVPNIWGNFFHGDIKMLLINVNDYNIFTKEGEILFPSTRKIKKIINNFIEHNKIPRKFTALKWIIVFILFILLIIAQIYMRNKFY